MNYSVSYHEDYAPSSLSSQLALLHTKRKADEGFPLTKKEVALMSALATSAILYSSDSMSGLLDAGGADEVLALITLEAAIVKASEIALDEAKKVAEEQLNSLKSSFGFTVDEVEKGGNAQRAAIVAIADAKNKVATDKVNRDITIATQPPVTSCTADTLIRILANRYPRVHKLKKNAFHLNLNRVFRGFADDVADIALREQNLANETRESVTSYPYDEHLNAAILTEKSTLSDSDTSKARAYLDSLQRPFSGSLLPADGLDSINSEIGSDYESKRGALRSHLSLAMSVLSDSMLLREGDRESFEELRDSILSLEGSASSLDRLYFSGLSRLLNAMSIEGENGETLSPFGALEFSVMQRAIPEYDEYIQNKGPLSTPYIKEMLQIERDDMRLKHELAKQNEKTTLLMSAIQQLSIQFED